MINNLKLFLIILQDDTKGNNQRPKLNHFLNFELGSDMLVPKSETMKHY